MQFPFKYFDCSGLSSVFTYIAAGPAASGIPLILIRFPAEPGILLDFRSTEGRASDAAERKQKRRAESRFRR